MANTIIDKGLPDLDEIWGSEVTLGYPGFMQEQPTFVGFIWDAKV